VERAGSRLAIVAANEEVDSSRREEREIRRIKTRSPINVVVVLYTLIKLADIHTLSNQFIFYCA
jgi:hypothetical protein